MALRIFLLIALVFWLPGLGRAQNQLPDDARLALESTLAWILHERGAEISPELEDQINGIRFLRFEGGIDPRLLRMTADGLWFDINPASPQQLHLSAPFDAEISLVSGSFGLSGGSFLVEDAELTWNGQIYRSQSGQWHKVFQILALHFVFTAEMEQRLGMTPEKQVALQTVLVAAYAEDRDYSRVLRDYLTGQALPGGFQQNDMSILQTSVCRLQDGTCLLNHLIGFIGDPF